MCACSGLSFMRRRARSVQTRRSVFAEDQVGAEIRSGRGVRPVVAVVTTYLLLQAYFQDRTLRGSARPEGAFFCRYFHLPVVPRWTTREALKAFNMLSSAAPARDRPQSAQGSDNLPYGRPPGRTLPTPLTGFSKQGSPWGAPPASQRRQEESLPGGCVRGERG